MTVGVHKLSVIKGTHVLTPTLDVSFKLWYQRQQPEPRPLTKMQMYM